VSTLFAARNPRSRARRRPPRPKGRDAHARGPLPSPFWAYGELLLGVSGRFARSGCFRSGMARRPPLRCRRTFCSGRTWSFRARLFHGNSVRRSASAVRRSPDRALFISRDLPPPPEGPPVGGFLESRSVALLGTPSAGFDLRSAKRAEWCAGLMRFPALGSEMSRRPPVAEAPFTAAWRSVGRFRVCLPDRARTPKCVLRPKT
jgi:hypothetical protein